MKVIGLLIAVVLILGAGLVGVAWGIMLLIGNLHSNGFVDHTVGFGAAFGISLPVTLILSPLLFESSKKS